MRSFSILAAIAVIVVSSATTTAQATTLTYSLNGSYAEDSNSGPSLVPYGGTLGPTGYSFGPNTGLSLSNAVTADGPYSIEINFYFDSVDASWDGYQRILDFKNRTSDIGLYSFNGAVQCFGCYGPYGPPNPVGFNAGQLDLIVTRTASGQFTVSVDGVTGLSALDNTELTKFSGPNNIIWFFVDDFQSLYFYPDTPEAGSGFIDSEGHVEYSCRSRTRHSPTLRHRPWLDGFA